VQDYAFLLADGAANHARFKTPTEFRRSGLSGSGFAATVLRHILFAVHEASRTEDAREGLSYLKAERPDYWSRKEDIIALLEYFASSTKLTGLPHWHKDAEAASVLAGAIRNDYVGSR
jgi:hypothetical protein